MRIVKILMLVVCTMLPLSAGATGHFPHHRGQYGDWFWKDVQGFYSAHTNGARTPQEYFTVFCNDPGSRGGVGFSIGVVAFQVGNRRLTLTFDNGKTIDVIANYARVSAASGPIATFASPRSTPCANVLIIRTTSNIMILVDLLIQTFGLEGAADGYQISESIH